MNYLENAEHIEEMITSLKPAVIILDESTAQAEALISFSHMEQLSLLYKKHLRTRKRLLGRPALSTPLLHL
ncbi:hypothetical protein VT98_11524 [Candidatus Electrothrix communis]|uniref:Uncharacterized protein n=1 Tax=Candidatus Electrothrix communis TaxID=1859133 RepID=A0A3S3RUM0_9BACT|nr:hypothetical protein VT98_11524 [Candidatus Electrothrix communis]